MLFLILASAMLHAQDDDRLNSYSAILAKMGFSYHFSGADLSERFGAFPGVSGGLDYVFPSGRWSLTAQYTYRYGNDVKEDVLDNIRNERGFVVGIDGFPSDLFLRQRAYSGMLGLNRLFRLNQNDDIFWLVVGGGVGYMQHWIRLQDERNTAAQLNGLYEAGYDRMTRGLTTHQYVGIQYLSSNKRINFFAGIELVQGFTSGVRSWDFDRRAKPDSGRIDLLNGIRVGWILPFYLNVNTEVIYY